MEKDGILECDLCNCNNFYDAFKDRDRTIVSCCNCGDLYDSWTFERIIAKHTNTNYKTIKIPKLNIDNATDEYGIDLKNIPEYGLNPVDFKINDLRKTVNSILKFYEDWAFPIIKEWYLNHSKRYLVIEADMLNGNSYEWKHYETDELDVTFSRPFQYIDSQDGRVMSEIRRILDIN